MIVCYLYMQVRFELIYESEISYLTVHLHEKARQDARFDMTLKRVSGVKKFPSRKMRLCWVGGSKLKLDEGLDAQPKGYR